MLDELISEPKAESAAPRSRRGMRGFRRTIRDVVLIVVSIVIAFALNAWWESVLGRREERRHLAAVRSELSANQTYLQSSLEDLDRIDAAVAELLSHMGPRPGSLPADSLAALFDYSFRFGTLELAMGSIQALLASGELALLSNDDLKRRLASWPSLAAEARNDALLLVENREEIIRHLDTLMPTLVIARNTGELDHYAPTKFPFVPARVLADSRVEGLLGNRGVRLGNVRGDVRQLMAQADTIISLIDQDG